MTKPYSLDLRERVTERVAAGDSVRAVATIFTVSVASVVRWSQRLRRTGSAAGGKMGGHRACTLMGERRWLMERIAAEPEVTVRGLMTEPAERGVAVSYGTVWNPIEQVFAKLKRKAKERTVDATWKRTGSLLETFKSSECKNYLVNAGYASS
jgi:transposase